MKNYLLLFPFLFVFLSACSQKPQKGDGKNVSAKEFKALIEKQDGTILDVRTPEEVVSGKIKGALNIDYYADFNTAISQLNKTKPVYIYCASGGRSSQAMQDLNTSGFKEVYNLSGGIGAWRAAKFSVE